MDTKKNITDKQLALDKRYIRMAQIWAENSYCQRRKVGALIVKDKMIISDGYNGTPAGFENCYDLSEHNPDCSGIGDGTSECRTVLCESKSNKYIWKNAGCI